MGSLVHFALIAIHFTNSLATQPISMKCVVQDNNFLNIFSPTSVPSVNLPQFGTVRVNSNILDKDGWILEPTNIEYQGIDHAILDEFGFNLVTNVLQITFHTDMLITYNYKTNGTLFSLPINGEGFTEVILVNVQIGMTMPFDIVEAEGNKYIDLKNVNSWYDIRDNIQFSFSNLYYGNKELSDTMHDLMNKNWKYISKEFGKGFMDKLADNIFIMLRNYLLSKPLRDFSGC